MGNQSKDILLSRGVLETKILVTGSPLFDKSIQSGSRFNETAVRKKLGIKKWEKVVLWLTQPFVEDGVWSAKTQNKLLQSVVHVVNNIDTLKLILKIHPREKMEDYKETINSYNNEKPIVIKDFDLNELVILSTAVLTVNSTAGLLAAIHKRPLFILDYWKDNSALLEDIGFRISNSKNLHEALSKLLIKTQEITYLKEGARQSVEKLLGNLDGKASHRIANIIAKRLIVNANSRKNYASRAFDFPLLFGR